MLNDLNKEQKIAVQTLEGPLLILAGAGTGKTKTITHRMAYMLSSGVMPYEILAVTFTNKAAKEMKERVIQLVGFVGQTMQISTFHSFGVQLLRAYCDRISLSKNFTIYDTDDQKKIINQVMKEKNITIEEYTASQLAGKISKLKESNIEPDAYIKESRFPVEKLIGEVYIGYNKTLRLNEAIDFSDILVLTNQLLKHKEVLDILQNRYKYILVDEYQDTNKIQYTIINEIAKKSKNLCVVGDEDQSIYGFRGADIQNILNFERDYPTAKVVKLEQNYRSTETILNAANAVIKNNLSSKGKKLWTHIKGSEKIDMLIAGTDREEAYLVCRKIREISDYKNSAILYRNNFQSRQMEDELRRQNIPYKIYGGIQFYQRLEIKDILGYLKVIANPDDELNLLRVINTPARGIGKTSLDKIMLASRTANKPVYEILAEIETVGLRGAAPAKILAFYALLENLKKLAETETVSALLKAVFEKSGYRKQLLEINENERVLNIEELINSAMDFEREEEGFVSLQMYLEHVSLAMTSDDINESDNHVKLMTVHASKGLEFDNVFIIGLEDEIFPGQNAYTEDEVEEERRLCYVAITRAKKHLIFSYANSRRIHGVMSFGRAHSRFLLEIPKNSLSTDNFHVKQSDNYRNLEGTLNTKNDIMSYINREEKSQEKPKIQLKHNVGDVICHKSFGEGKVVAANIDLTMIYFPGIGEKKFVTKILERFVTKA